MYIEWMVEFEWNIQATRFSCILCTDTIFTYNYVLFVCKLQPIHSAVQGITGINSHFPLRLIKNTLIIIRKKKKNHLTLRKPMTASWEIPNSSPRGRDCSIDSFPTGRAGRSRPLAKFGCRFQLTRRMMGDGWLKMWAKLLRNRIRN